MPEEEPIHESGGGKKADTPKSITDPEAKRIAKTFSYEIFANRRLGRVYICTTEYHAGVLVIEKAGLELLVNEAFPLEQQFTQGACMDR